jgi:hypothetical protein
MLQKKKMAVNPTNTINFQYVKQPLDSPHESATRHHQNEWIELQYESICL